MTREALTFFGTDGSRVADPPLDLLEAVVFRNRGPYWRAGSGETSRLVVGAPGVAARRRLPGAAGHPARTGGASTRVPTTRGCSGGTGSPAA